MSDLEGFPYCMKYLLFIFNFIVWLLGVTLFAVGIWIRSDYTIDQLAQAADFEYYYAGSYIIIAAGVIICVIGFLGCWGSLREQPCMLATYFVFMVVVFILELSACAYVFSVGLEDSGLDKYVRRTLLKAIDRSSSNPHARELLDAIQINLYCCGSENWMDYEKYNKVVPDSCRHEITGRQHELGCFANVVEFIEEKTGIIGGLSLVVCFLEIFAMVMSLCLCQAIKKVNG